MSAEEEFIDFVVGSLMKGHSVEDIISTLVAGGMAEEDARAAVTSINDQLMSSEFRDIIAGIERELESGKTVDEIVAGIVETGIPEEKARPVVLLLAMQVLMKRGTTEAFIGSLINALIIIGDDGRLLKSVTDLGIPEDTVAALLNGIEALASTEERVDRGENVALKAMEEFVRLREAIESGETDGILDRLSSEGADREAIESFITAAEYLITLEKNARDTDVKEKDKQGRTD